MAIFVFIRFRSAVLAGNDRALSRSCISLIRTLSLV